MALQINLRHLEKKPLELNGELTSEELELGSIDDLIKATLPLTYELEAQLIEESVLVQGELYLELDCECARCLKPFKLVVDLPEWACHLPLSGEDRVQVDNDLVDLTPYIREDILLNLPQHPLCEEDCRGLPKTALRNEKKTSGASQNVESSSAWAELNKLKFEKE